MPKIEELQGADFAMEQEALAETTTLVTEFDDEELGKLLVVTEDESEKWKPTKEQGGSNA